MPLHLVANWLVFTIYICCFITKIGAYKFKCLFKRFLNLGRGYVSTAEIWQFLNLNITAVAILDFYTLKILTADRIHRVNVYHHTNFLGDRSNRC